MTRPASPTWLGSEFDTFLFAAIGDERNGMTLSVLSALARQDLDPWQEAAKLAGLPGDTATRTMVAMIAALPDGQSARLDPGASAERLIALLPRHPSFRSQSRETLLDISVKVTPGPFIQVMIFAILTTLILGTLLSISISQHRPRVDNACAPASIAVLPSEEATPYGDCRGATSKAAVGD